MNKVINLDYVKSKNRKELEGKACGKYGVIKVDDELYLYPQVYFTSGSLRLIESFQTLDITIEEFLEEEAIEAINEIVDSPEQTVGIMLVEEKENNMHTFEIMNINTNESFLLTTRITNNLQNMEMLTAIVAGAIKTINVQVIYMLKLTFNELEKAIY